MEQNCGNCRFWRPKMKPPKQESGKPKAIRGGDCVRFPHTENVHEEHYCGEFDAAPRAGAKS